MIQYAHDFLWALFLTVSIETTLVLFILKKFYKDRVSITNIVSAGIFANALTLPYVWFIFPRLFTQPKAIIFSEMFAFLIEAIFYKTFLKLSYKKAFIISLIANLITYSLSLILNL